MGFTKTKICNMAVSHCGIATEISDIEIDRSIEAVKCRLYYDDCVELLLEMLPWPFAETRFTLSDIGTPPSDWDYRYAYPNTCKRINKIVNPYKRTPDTINDEIEYKIIDIADSPGTGRAIVTDIEDAEIDGNRWITDVNMFSATFGMALSMFLATFIATPLRVKKDVVDDVRKQWAVWLSEAQVQAKAERQDAAPRDSEFVYARN